MVEGGGWRRRIPVIVGGGGWGGGADGDGRRRRRGSATVLAATLQSTQTNTDKDALGRMTIPSTWTGQSRRCQQVALLGDARCCDEGLHRGRHGDDESLGGRRPRDGSNGGDSSTMVGAAAVAAAAATTTTVAGRMTMYRLATRAGRRGRQATRAGALGVRRRLQRRRLAAEVNGGDRRIWRQATGGSGGGTCGGSGGRRIRW